MGDLINSRRPQADEGEAIRTKSSALRYQSQQTTYRPTSADDILSYPRTKTQRASRPAPQTNNHARSRRPITSIVPKDAYGYGDAEEFDTGDDPELELRRRPRTTDAVRRPAPSTRSRSASKTYIPANNDGPQKNREQRRHGIQFHWSVFVGMGMIALLLLWFFATLIVLVCTNGLYNPAHYGPTQGDTQHLTLGGKDLYLQGINTDGKTYVIVIPTGHPEQSHILIGPHVSKDASVDLELKDVNGDGKEDIVEHIVAPMTVWQFAPSEQHVVFYGDGKGNFKSLQEAQ